MIDCFSRKPWTSSPVQNWAWRWTLLTPVFGRQWQGGTKGKVTCNYGVRGLSGKLETLSQKKEGRSGTRVGVLWLFGVFLIPLYLFLYRCPAPHWTGLWFPFSPSLHTLCLSPVSLSWTHSLGPHPHPPLPRGRLPALRLLSDPRGQRFG